MTKFKATIQRDSSYSGLKDYWHHGLKKKNEKKKVYLFLIKKHSVVEFYKKKNS